MTTVLAVSLGTVSAGVVALALGIAQNAASQEATAKMEIREAMLKLENYRETLKQLQVANSQLEVEKSSTIEIVTLIKGHIDELMKNHRIYLYGAGVVLLVVGVGIGVLIGYKNYGKLRQWFNDPEEEGREQIKGG